MPLPRLTPAARRSASTCLAIACAAVLGPCLSGLPASAAQGTATISDAFVGGQDAALDGFLQVTTPPTTTQQATTPRGAVEAAVADLCFAANPFSIEVDRVRIPLVRAAGGWSGNGLSQAAGVPVKATLLIEANASGIIALSGTIDWMGTTITLPVQEREIGNDDSTAVAGREAWAANQVSVTVPTGKMPALLAMLRETGGDLDTAGLVPTCADLRAGAQNVTVTVPPERARSVRDKLAGIAGITASLFTRNGLDNAVRFEAAKIAGGPGATVGERTIADAVLASALQLLPGSASLEPPRRDDASGRWVLNIGRSSPLLDTLDLSEVDTMFFLIQADPSDGTRAILSFEETAGRLVAKNPGKLRLATPATPMESFGSYVLASSTFLTALGAKVAVGLNGQVYDTASEAWQAP